MKNFIKFFFFFFFQQVHQLKDAIQYHNDSIQFLKRQNAELKADLDDKKIKVRSEFDAIKKRF